MNKFLFFLLAAAYLLSPWAPSWGPGLVALGVFVKVFAVMSKFVPKRRYED